MYIYYGVINIIEVQYFNIQLMHITLKNVELFKTF